MCIIIKLEKGWTGVGFKVRINTTCSLLPSQTQQPVERSHKHKWRHWDPLPEEGKYCFQPHSQPPITPSSAPETERTDASYNHLHKAKHVTANACIISLSDLSADFQFFKLSGSPVPVFEKVRRVSFIKQVPVFLSIHFEFLLLKVRH